MSDSPNLGKKYNRIDMDHILDRRKNMFSSSYLTIIAITQSLALSLLISQFFPWSFDASLGWQDGFVAFRYALTFLIIVTVWHEYHWASFIFFWTPRLKDSLIPFAIGALEAFCIYSIEKPHLFSLAVALLSFGGVYAYANTRRNYVGIPFEKPLGGFYQEVNAVSKRASWVMGMNGFAGSVAFFYCLDSSLNRYLVYQAIVLSVFLLVVLTLFKSSNDLIRNLDVLIGEACHSVPRHSPQVKAGENVYPSNDTVGE